MILESLMDEMPLVSIVTPCLNRKDFIADAVESVLQQDYPRLEHVIADGGSTDGTLDVLARYPHLNVVSEPDRNLYDGLNKALARTTGDIIGWLNSDDILEPGTIRLVVDTLRQHAEADLVNGSALVFAKAPDGTVHIVRTLADAKKIQLSIMSVLCPDPIINARFYRRRLLDRVGPFRTDYLVVADVDFLMRVVLTDPVCINLNRFFYRYRQHAGSLTFQEKQAPRWRDDLGALEIVDRLLSDPQTPKHHRRGLRHAHSTWSALLINNAVFSLDLKRTLWLLWRGCRRDFTFPFYLLAFLGKWFRKKILGKEIDLY